MGAKFFLEGEELSFEQFTPFKNAQLWFKGGDPDTSVDDTEDQKVLSQIANERFDRYRNVFRPVEDKYMDDVSDINSQANQQQGGGMAAANVESAFSDAVKGDVLAVTGRGSNISGGGVDAAITKRNLEKAVSRSDNVNKTKQSIQDNYVGGLQGIVAMGNGQSSEAIQGLGDVASNSNQEAQDSAVRDFNNESSRREAAGFIGGATYGGVKALNDKESAV